LIAEIDNFPEVANRLKESATQEAWEVIETVLDEVLQRGQRKLTAQLAPEISIVIPAETCDAQEQLALLFQLVHHQPLHVSRRGGLTGPDQNQVSVDGTDSNPRAPLR
jgi:hypothetical protein